MMRVPLCFALVALLAGCAAKPESASPVAEPQPAPPDAIERLVARLSASRGLWLNGVTPRIDLPATAPVADVVAQLFQKSAPAVGAVTRHDIIESRQVRIPTHPADIGPDATYTAVLVDTNLGRRVVLMQYGPPSGGWWSRSYDAETSI